MAQQTKNTTVKFLSLRSNETKMKSYSLTQKVDIFNEKEKAYPEAHLFFGRTEAYRPPTI